MKVATLGFDIKYHGDESVGVFTQEWQMVGIYRFESESDYNKFVKELKGLFELVSDGPIDVQPIAIKNED